MSTRKSPKESATLFREGTIEEGPLSRRYVVKKTTQGVKRWMPYESTTLHGFHVAKISDISKTKPTVLYERAYMDNWPTSTRKLEKVVFRPTGKYNTKWGPEGYLKFKGAPEFLGVLTVNKKTKLVSTNLLNTEAFIHLHDS